MEINVSGLYVLPYYFHENIDIPTTVPTILMKCLKIQIPVLQ